MNQRFQENKNRTDEFASEIAAFRKETNQKIYQAHGKIQIIGESIVKEG